MVDIFKVLLLEAKFFPPPPPKQLLKRELLFSDDRFNAQLLTIQGPAGYGKSTSIADWLSATKEPNTWLSLDDNDNDLTSFWQYMVQAFLRMNVGVSPMLLDMLNDDKLNSIEPTITALLNELFLIERESVEESENNIFNPLGILVLDDFHKIDNKDIHSSFASFISYLPARFKLIIISRSQMPFETKKLIIQDKLQEISFVDLRFSPTDTENYLRKRIDLPLSDKDLKLIHKKTGGWPAALQLLSLAIKAEDKKEVDKILKELDKGQTSISSLLIEEVLSQQTPEMRLFLHCSALLPRLSIPVCKVIMEDVAAENLFSKAKADGLFLIALDQNDLWFRYHDLFRSLLIERCKIHYPKEKKQIIETAAIWFEENNYIQEALELIFEAEQWQRAIQLIEAYAFEKLDTGQRETVNKWLMKLPKGLLEDSPTLLMLQIRSLPNSIQLKTAPTQLTRIKQIISKQLLDKKSESADQLRQLYFETLMLMAFHARLLGDYDNGLAWAIEATEVQSLDQSKHPDRSHYILGLSYYNAGNMQKAKFHCQTSIEYSLSQNDPSLAVITNIYLVAILIIMGETDNAELAYQKLRQWLVNAGLEGTLVDVWTEVSRAWLSIEIGELDRSEKNFQLAFANFDLDDEVVTQPLLEIGLLKNACLVSMAQKRYQASRQYLTRVIDLQAAYDFHNTNGMQSLKGFEIDICHRTSEFEEVKRWVEEGGEQLEKETHFTFEADQFVLARAFIEFQQFSRCIAMVRAVRERAVAGSRIKRVVSTYLYEAICYHHKSDHSKAAAAFSTALSMAKKANFSQTLLDEQDYIVELLKDSRYTQGNLDYASNILKLINNDYSDNALQPSKELLVEDLSIRETEVLQLLEVGLRNKDIAQRLELTVGTVKWHLKNTYQKLAVGSRTEAVAKARKLAIIH